MASKRPWRGGTYCCLPGCGSCSANKERLYRIPTLNGRRRGVETKEWADKFHQVVFRFRYDSKFEKKVLSGKAYICSKHFKPSDIIQTSHCSTLQFGSLPTMNLPEKCNRAKPPLKRRKIIEHLSLDNNIQEPLIVLSSVCDIMNNWKPFESPGWRIHQISETKVHLTNYQNDLLHATSSISLLITEKDRKLQFSIAFNGVYAPAFSASLGFGTLSLQDFLQYLGKLSVCSGYESIPDGAGWCCREVSHMQGDGVVLKKRFFSNNCVVCYSGDAPTCNSCSAAHVFENYLSTYEHRLKREWDMEGQGVQLCNTAPLSTCSKDGLRSTMTIIRQKMHRLELELRERGERVSDSISSVIDDCSKLSSDDFLKEWWTVQKKLHGTEANKQRRYPPSVIKYCLMLYPKSPSAHRLAQNIMVLPSDTTLCNVKVESLNRWQAGIQDGVVARIADALKLSKSCHEKFAVLCIDEMTVKDGLAFQSSTGNVVGYVEYDGGDLNSSSVTSERVALHMLAVLVKGVTNKNLDGVVAFYPTSCAPAADLATLLNHLLVEIPCLTSITIVGVVFDELRADRSVMETLCQKEEEGSLKYRMKNPVDHSRYIYFVPDPPHLLKTTRDNLLNQDKYMWNEGYITIQPIKELIAKDMAHGGLRLFPQLNESHVSPSPAEKMDVKIAAQTLSATLGSALSETHPALGKFLLTMDRWFDAVNAGFQGVKKFKHERRPFHSSQDERLQWLEHDFPRYLREWRACVCARPLSDGVTRSSMLLSSQTEKGLRVATKSMVAIIKECLAMGAEYVLPRRVNQNSLEAYFGYQRQKADVEMEVKANSQYKGGAHLHCCVPMCANDSRRMAGLSFHRIPVDEKLRRMWISKIRRVFKITHNTRVCGKHFTPDQFMQTPSGIRRLRYGSVPSIFPWTTSTDSQRGTKRCYENGSPVTSGLQSATSPTVDGTNQDKKFTAEQCLEKAALSEPEIVEVNLLTDHTHCNNLTAMSPSVDPPTDHTNCDENLTAEHRLEKAAPTEPGIVDVNLLADHTHCNNLTEISPSVDPPPDHTNCDENLTEPETVDVILLINRTHCENLTAKQRLEKTAPSETTLVDVLKDHAYCKSLTAKRRLKKPPLTEPKLLN